MPLALLTKEVQIKVWLVYASYSAHRNLGQRSEKCLFQRSIAFGRKEESTQHAAELQLSVCKKSRTNFVKTYVCKDLNAINCNFKLY